MLQPFGDPNFSINWQVNLVAGSTSGSFGESGNTDGNSIDARFYGPANIAVDPFGNVYVADLGNSRVRKITPLLDVSTLAGSTDGYADGVGAAAMFSFPFGIAVDSAGYVYVGEIYRVRRVSPTGVVTTVAGTGVQGDDDGPGNQATVFYVRGLAVDSDGSVLLTSAGFHLSGVSTGLRVRHIERIISVGRD